MEASSGVDHRSITMSMVFVRTALFMLTENARRRRSSGSFATAVDAARGTRMAAPSDRDRAARNERFMSLLSFFWIGGRGATAQYRRGAGHPVTGSVKPIHDLTPSMGTGETRQTSRA